MRPMLIAASALALAGCNVIAKAEKMDAGPLAKRSYPVGTFDSVSLGGPHNVVVTVGPKASVRAEGPANILDRLEIEVRNGDLHVGTRHGSWHMSFGDHPPVTIYVTTPALSAASIGGSGDMRIDKVEGGKFTGSIGGSGDMDIAALKVDDATFSVAGSGDIKAAGSADSSSVSIAGSGGIDTSSVASKTVSVSIVGSGDASAHASDSATVSVMGSGDVTIAGTAKCSVHKAGSGDVRCGS